MTKSLDLGCGPNPQNPFNADEVFGIDIRSSENSNIVAADLNIEKIPFPDNFFEYITAFDFIEHVPRILYLNARRFPFVELMNEIYRTLKNGGIFYSFTPAFPKAPAWRDPTHVNIITDETYSKYFDNTERLAKMYGFTGSFQIVDQYWHSDDVHLISILRKNV
jgi:SAM-dependent methyltransferase